MAIKGITRNGKRISFYLEGGAMAPEEDPNAMPPEGAPEEGMPAEGGQDPMMMIAQACAQALQTQDCQVAMQACQAFLELLQQAQGGAPAEEQGAPVYRKGGILVRRIKK